MYIKVKNKKIVGNHFYLSNSYVLESGETICGVECLSDVEKLALGLYPVVDITPAYNQNYEYLGEQSYTLKVDCVELTHVIETVKLSSFLVEQRLATFAKEKDIDFQEVALLLQSDNVTWQQEAITFVDLYEKTWQAFYVYTGDSWQELEATLPVLSW